MTTPFLFVANWKMYKTYQESVAFIHEYAHALHTQAQRTHAHVVVCPSFEALDAIGTRISSYDTLSLGAQGCSTYLRGAYTGQVSAQSLTQLNCRYAIIGHRETREYWGETDEQITHKAHLLRTQGIMPLICIGETAEEQQAGRTLDVLTQQLYTLQATLNNMSGCYLVYEPQAAIGSGNILQAQQIASVMEHITNTLAQQEPAIRVPLLYGGSITPDTISTLKPLRQRLDGLLIGGASLAGENLIKIMQLWYV